MSDNKANRYETATPIDVDDFPYFWLDLPDGGCEAPRRRTYDEAFDDAKFEAASIDEYLREFPETPLDTAEELLDSPVVINYYEDEDSVPLAVFTGTLRGFLVK